MLTRHISGVQARFSRSCSLCQMNLRTARQIWQVVSCTSNGKLCRADACIPRSDRTKPLSNSKLRRLQKDFLRRVMPSAFFRICPCGWACLSIKVRRREKTLISDYLEAAFGMIIWTLAVFLVMWWSGFKKSIMEVFRMEFALLMIPGLFVMVIFAVEMYHYLRWSVYSATQRGAAGVSDTDTDTCGRYCWKQIINIF